MNPSTGPEPAFSSVAGHGTRAPTHEADVRVPSRTCGDIEIGDHSFGGKRCTAMAGALLPERSDRPDDHPFPTSGRTAR